MLVEVLGGVAMIKKYGRKVTSKHVFWISAQCGSNICQGVLSPIRWGWWWALPPVGSLENQMLEIRKTHHLLTYFSGSFRHQEPLAATAPKHAVFMSLKPPGSCFTITYPESSVRAEEVWAPGGDKRVERKRSLGVRYCRFFGQQIAEKKTLRTNYLFSAH